MTLTVLPVVRTIRLVLGQAESIYGQLRPRVAKNEVG